MGQVLTHMTMSLDGFIADPDDQVGELFEWYEAGDVSVPTQQRGRRLRRRRSQRRDAPGPDRAQRSTRLRPALVRHHQRLGRQSPRRRRRRRRDPPRTGGRRRALAEDDLRRRRGAGDRHGTRDRRGQERRHRQPRHHPPGTRAWAWWTRCASASCRCCFGEGIPYFSKLDRGHLLLEDPVITPGRRALHLRYPVRR